MKIIKVPVKTVKSNPNNPRIIKDEKFKKLVKSIQDAPWMLELRPIVVNSDMIVLGGNMRLKAAIEGGFKIVPIVQAETLTLEQQEEFIIKDNLGYGEWDFDALNNDWDKNLLDEWGLDMPDITQAPPVVEDGYNDPLPKEVDIIEGDLFVIGPHRLICGDSTRIDHVEKLLGGEEPYLMVTDPPYGVEYDAKWRNKVDEFRRTEGPVVNDKTADWTDAWAISPSKVAYIYHAAKYTHKVAESLTRADFELRSQIVWAKNHFAIGRGNYHWKHENCWYAVKNNTEANWIGGRDQTTVWEIDKPRKTDTGHSTQKPIECMYRAIKNHKGDVYDPFLGSGTTMIAADQLNRRCFGVEISPVYCQVIINRVLKLKPEYTVFKNSLPYARST